jgi:hypothetical protein
MSTLITIVVALAILVVVSRSLWPRNRRAPFPLYVGTIVGAFFVGFMAGSLADGREFWRSLQFAGIVVPVMGAVAALSWLRIKSPGAEDREKQRVEAEREQARQRRARDSHP